MSLSNDENAFQMARLAPFLDGPQSNPLTAGNRLIGDLNTRLRDIQKTDRGLTDANDPGGLARAANREQENAIGLQRAGLLHDERTALFDAVPERMIGGVGGGVGVSVTPFAAMAAAFGGGFDPTVGSFGRPSGANFTHAGSGASAHPGGTQGAFSDAASAAIVAKLGEILQTLKTGGHAPGPGNPAGQVLSHAINLSNIGTR
jgi:hypothetical protein